MSVVITARLQYGDFLKALCDTHYTKIMLDICLLSEVDLIYEATLFLSSGRWLSSCQQIMSI